MELSTEAAVNSTGYEIKFLDGLVTKGWVIGHTKARAKQALEGYIRASANRNWDTGVDAVKVMHRARQLLDECRG